MSIDVSEADFQSQVIEHSKQQAVLVDFWAEWCGPCRMLGPVLHKLEEESNGRFLLAKLNTDHNQSIAGKYQISGIPAVKLFVDGGVVGEFTGALPESAVKRFLDEHLPDPSAEEILLLSKSDPISAAKRIISENRSGDQFDEVLWLAGWQALIAPDSHDLAQAQRFFQAINDIGPRADHRTTVITYLDNQPDENERKQFAPLFQGDETKALDYFLNRVEQSDGKDRDRERLKLLLCFHVLGPENPLVNEYRRRLSAVLF